MIKKEGGCIDERHGSVWVVLTHDPAKCQTSVKVKKEKDGQTVAVNGITGPRAKMYYDKLNQYFFGNE